jgi:hypothetical protein
VRRFGACCDEVRKLSILLCQVCRCLLVSRENNCSLVLFPNSRHYSMRTQSRTAVIEPGLGTIQSDGIVGLKIGQSLMDCWTRRRLRLGWNWKGQDWD